MTARVATVARLTAVSVTMLFACVATAAAQTTVAIPGPNGTIMVTSSVSGPRDNTPEPTGTGRIRGRVVEAEKGSALQDTQLRLSGGGLREIRTVGTDDQGRFEFENLPAGRYSLTELKPGYIALAYGQRRPFEAGRPIELADKQVLDGVDFAVPRGGVIVAHVTDEDGDPISDVRVVAMRYRFAGGERTLSQVNTAAIPFFQGTDDRGDVRVYGLPPGEYYVSASALLGASGLGAAASGRSYIPTFFPGTTSTDLAQRVPVEVGKEVNVSFALVAAKLARVSGAIRRADGSSTGARTSVSIVGKGPGSIGRGVPVQPNGTFTVADLPPGEYSVQASFGSAPQNDRELGRVVINLNGSDVTNLVVPMVRGGTVRGRLSFEPARPANIRVTTVQLYVAPPSGSISIGPQPVQDDGTFAITGVFDPGTVRIVSLPVGWFLKSVTLGGKDVTDDLVSVESGAELTGIEVVLTQTRAELSGSAADAKGAAVSDYAVVIFPEERAQWTSSSRFIASARPDQQGRFKVTGLPGGKYLTAAVDYIEAGSERDPDLLNRLRDRATPVTVVEGEAKTVTLTVQ